MSLHAKPHISGRLRCEHAWLCAWKLLCAISKVPFIGNIYIESCTTRGRSLEGRGEGGRGDFGGTGGGGGGVGF